MKLSGWFFTLAKYLDHAFACALGRESAGALSGELHRVVGVLWVWKLFEVFVLEDRNRPPLQLSAHSDMRKVFVFFFCLQSVKQVLGIAHLVAYSSRNVMCVLWSLSSHGRAKIIQIWSGHAGLAGWLAFIYVDV